MILSLINILYIHDNNFSTTEGVILVTIWVRLVRAEENPGHANLFIHTDRNSSKHEIQDGMNIVFM